MLRPKHFFLSLLLIWPAVVSSGQEAGKLWPEIKPYQVGYLQVSPLHEIFYQVGGNPKESGDVSSRRARRGMFAP